MSLINKMLQDLDARGSTGAGAGQLDVKPVARAERRLSVPLALGVLGGAVAIAGAATIGWRYLQKPPGAAAMVGRPAVVVMQPAPKLLAVAQPVPAPAAVAVAVPVSSSAAEPVSSPVPTKVPPAAAPALPVAEEEAAQPEPEPVPAPVPAKVVRVVAPAKVKRTEADAKPKNAAPAPRPVVVQVAAKSVAVKTVAAIPVSAKPPAAAASPAGGARRGEDAYRRALASMQEGRVNETIALLEQALQAAPRHDAARQTLIGLLVESGRGDEAIRQLQQALSSDARQPALAMLLARLQIERGASGIETLTRTLPYAGGNAEYMAFLAGALQRQGRHQEAADQYQAALRGAPGQGVWWMGLGISLQVEKRNAEALAAFRRAQGAGTLTPELQAFVERKLQQLSR
jgi:MSHA biogenesis protein MshN